MSPLVWSRRGALAVALVAFVLLGARSVDAGNAARSSKKAPAQPTAEQVLERYVQACGGRAAFDSIRSSVSYGTVEVGGLALTGELESYWNAPNSFYQVINLSMVGPVEFGVRDTVCWKRSGGQPAQLVTGNERRDVLAQVNPFPEITWRRSFRSVRTVGVDTVETRPAFRVELIDLEGNVSFADFDQETGLLVRRSTPAAVTGSPLSIELRSDYRAVGGVRVPFRLVAQTGKNAITTTWDSIEFNVPLPPSRFEPPAEVKAVREP
jgi:zinc protease